MGFEGTQDVGKTGIVALYKNGPETPLPGNDSRLFAPVPEPGIRAGVEAMSLVLLDMQQKKQALSS